MAATDDIAPTTPGFADELSAVLVAAVTTDCDSGSLLAAKLVSPDYVARMGCVPADRYVAAQVALPLLMVTAAQPLIVCRLGSPPSRCRCPSLWQCTCSGCGNRAVPGLAPVP